MTATPTPLDLLAALFGPAILDHLLKTPHETHLPKSPNHQEGFEEGLIESLDRTMSVIEEFPDLSLSDLYEILAEIRAELTGEDEEVEEAVGTDPTLDLLRAIFGPDVQIIAVEPAPR